MSQHPYTTVIESRWPLTPLSLSRPLMRQTKRRRAAELSRCLIRLNDTHLLSLEERTARVRRLGRSPLYLNSLLLRSFRSTLASLFFSSASDGKNDALPKGCNTTKPLNTSVGRQLVNNFFVGSH